MTEHELSSLACLPVPQCFPSPFDIKPHPLAQVAARDLQELLRSFSETEHNFFSSNGGKMFGVLVVQRPDVADAGDSKAKNRLAYLAAFSGMLGGSWLREGFAPPVFELPERDRLLGDGEQKLRSIKKEIDRHLQSSKRIELQQQLSAIAVQRQQALDEASTYYQNRRRQRHDIRHETRHGNNQGVHLHNYVASTAPSNEQSIGDVLAQQSQKDKSEFKALKSYWAQRIGVVQSQLDDMDNTIAALKQTRKTLSRRLQQQLFAGYRLSSYDDVCAGTDKCRDITSFFKESLPPGGTGDCASIKLLHQCYQRKLKPVCLAEFWWGASPPGGVRHHDHFYPACRGKCRPILPHMLSGLKVESPSYEAVVRFPPRQPEILFEDDNIIVLLKPAGMLSVAGKTISDSVENRLRSRYPMLVPDKLSRLLLHRLDQATSGVMVAAKDAGCHKALHQQFERREVGKCYIAVVDGRVDSDGGVVDLPLRVDLDDRPRQMVCYQYGKPAKTRYRVLSRSHSQSRLQLFPVTGRTHQLRVHLAHPNGLNAPIAGDELYGTAAGRLHLHAEQLSFRHPLTGELLSFQSPATF